MSELTNEQIDQWVSTLGNKRRTYTLSLRLDEKSNRANREKCFVCGQHGLITENHHAVSLREYADVIEQYDNESDIPDVPLLWLCPSHHTYWHSFIYSVKKKQISIVIDLPFLSDFEKSKYKEMQDMRYDWYRKLYQKLNGGV